MHRLSMLLAALVLIACDPGVRIGETCDLDSQCSEPLVCRLGRCRSACGVSRDCGAGFECLLDEDGLGSCSLDLDSCSVDRACPFELVCDEDRCRTGCARDVDCPRDSVCAEGTCLVVQAFDGGPQLDAGPADAGPLDAAPGDSGAATYACTFSEECPADTACSADFCYATCDSESDCPLRSACFAARGYVDGGSAHVCTPLCVPGTSAGCPSGQTCFVDQSSEVTGPTYVFTRCAVPGPFAVGCACTTSGACAAGLSCNTTRGVCAEVCRLDDVAACGGLGCEAGDPRYTRDGVAYGFCAPPASPICP